MYYASRTLKKALDSNETPVLTKIILMTALEFDSIKSEDDIKLALKVLRQSNREIFPHLSRNKQMA